MRGWREAEQPIDPDAMAEIAGSLLDLARVQEGDLPRDPADFARRITGVAGGTAGRGVTGLVA